jgi:HEAT repeat protein
VTGQSGRSGRDLKVDTSVHQRRQSDLPRQGGALVGTGHAFWKPKDGVAGKHLEPRATLAVVGHRPNPMRTRAHRSLVAGAALSLLFSLPLSAIAADNASAEAERTLLSDLRSKSVRRRFYGAENLYNAGDHASAAAPGLVKMLPMEPDPEVRAMIARAIGATSAHFDGAVPTLITTLQQDRAPDVRAGAAQALGRIGLRGAEAVPALITALEDRSNAALREQAAKALGAKGFAEYGNEIAPALTTALSDDSSNVAAAAGSSLRSLGPKAIAALSMLRAVLRPVNDGNSPPEAYEVLQVLGLLGPAGAAAAPECLVALDSNSPEVRVEAAGALLGLGTSTREAMNTLSSALVFAPDPNLADASGLRKGVVVRAAALIGLHSRHATPTVLPPLAALLEDPDPDVRRFAARSFDQVLPALVAARSAELETTLDRTRQILARISAPDVNVRIVAVDNALHASAPAQGVRAVEGPSPRGAGNAGRAIPDPVIARTFLVALGVAVVIATAGAILFRRRLSEWLIRRPKVRVFISYRRQDSGAWCGRIYDHLVDQLGISCVFRDIDSLAPGDLFEQRISERLRNCDAVIALIGNSWLTSVDTDGHPRLNDPADFVRIELIQACVGGKPVFPVLVDGATMPRVADLPSELRFIPQANALQVSDRHFALDMRILIEALSRARIEHSSPLVKG